MNAMFVLHPYYDRSWLFDEPSRGLYREPFVAGVPAIIDSLTAHLPDARSGFRLTFSANEFPGYARKYTRVREELGGCWYSDGPLLGWLCPALFRFFREPPPAIYARADSL